MARACSSSSARPSVPPSPGRQRTLRSQSRSSSGGGRTFNTTTSTGALTLSRHTLNTTSRCSLLAPRRTRATIAGSVVRGAFVCIMRAWSPFQACIFLPPCGSVVANSPECTCVSASTIPTLILYSPTETPWLIYTLLSLILRAALHSAGLTSKPCMLPLLPCGLEPGPPATPRP